MIKWFWNYFSVNCTEGNVKIDADNIPYLFYGGKWSPICGHHFWDNDYGAKAFCNKLGYNYGIVSRGGHGHYDQDAIEVGKCKAGEDINSCTAANNFYTNTGWCKKGTENNGKGVKIMISCEGHSKGTKKTSCSGNTDNQRI